MKFKLPDEVYERARELFGREGNLMWEVGDFLAGLWDEIGDLITSKYFDGDDGEAHEWLISDIAFQAGQAKSTVRDREAMSRFYPTDVREEYQPPFTYSHLRAAKGAGDEWREVLEWALNQMEVFGGSLPPVESLRSRSNGEEAWLRFWNTLLRSAKKLLKEESTPNVVQSLCASVVEMEVSVAEGNLETNEDPPF